MRTRQLVRPGLAAVIATALAACVPTPTSRVTPTADGPGASPAPPAATPSASPSPSFVRPSPNPSPTFLIYEVQRGDTLTSIARLFGTTARSIAYWNRARYPSLDPDSSTYEPNRIVSGWTLQLIPTAVVDEDELPDPTPTPELSPLPGASASSNPS
jgi:LysM domain